MHKKTYYLKQYIIIIVALITSVMLLIKNMKLAEKNIVSEEKADKNSSVIKTFNLWMQHKQQNKSITKFFEQNNFYEIAIYGMHFLGERVADELRETTIEIKYAIDRNINLNDYNGIRVVRMDEALDKVDAVVVTPVYYFDEIERQLSSLLDCPIISLEEVINNS